MKRFSILFTVLVAFVSIASATIVNPGFSFSSGDRAASANFTQSGSNLVVTLTNTSGVDVTANPFLLTAVFFDITPSATLTPVSAILPAGSSIQNAAACDIGPCAGVTNVGGEWAYAAGLAGAPGGATRGISSTGVGLFSSSNNFPGANLDGPADVNGPQFGITSAGDSNATLPSGGNIPYIKNSVVYTLSGLVDTNYTISNVFFLYGTALSGETGCTGPCGGPGNEIPEPGYLLTLALLGVPVVLKYRRRRQTA